MIKAIIWDMDGTLINSEDYWTLMPRFWLKMQQDIDLSDEEWENASFRRVGFRRTVKTLFEEGGYALSGTLEEAIAWCLDYMYSEIYGTDKYIRFKPNARDSLDVAQALHIPMCLITATVVPSAKFTLDRMDFERYFDFWQSTETGMDKHDPRIFEMAAERMGVKAEECLLIEDSLYSMKTGRTAGCTVWAIEDPKHKADVEVIKQTAHRYFNNHTEMAQALKELNK